MPRPCRPGARHRRCRRPQSVPPTSAARTRHQSHQTDACLPFRWQVPPRHHLPACLRLLRPQQRPPLTAQSCPSGSPIATRERLTTRVTTTPTLLREIPTGMRSSLTLESRVWTPALSAAPPSYHTASHRCLQRPLVLYRHPHRSSPQAGRRWMRPALHLLFRPYHHLVAPWTRTTMTTIHIDTLHPLPPRRPRQHRPFREACLSRRRHRVARPRPCRRQLHRCRNTSRRTPQTTTTSTRRRLRGSRTTVRHRRRRRFPRTSTHLRRFLKTAPLHHPHHKRRLHHKHRSAPRSRHPQRPRPGPL